MKPDVLETPVLCAIDVLCRCIFWAPFFYNRAFDGFLFFVTLRWLANSSFCALQHPIPFSFRVLPFQGDYVWCLGFLPTFAFFFMLWLVDFPWQRPPTVGNVKKLR